MGRESLNTSLTDSGELFPFFFPPWRQRAEHSQTVNWGRDLDSLNLLTCAARWMVCDSPSSHYTKHRLIMKGQDLNIALGLFVFNTQSTEVVSVSTFSDLVAFQIHGNNDDDYYNNYDHSFPCSVQNVMLKVLIWHLPTCRTLSFVGCRCTAAAALMHGRVYEWKKCFLTAMCLHPVSEPPGREKSPHPLLPPRLSQCVLWT